MEGEGGLGARLAAEHGGDLSLVPSDLGGVWGTSPAPLPRTAWRLPTEGEGSPAGLRVRAGTGIETGAEGQPGSPGPTPRPPLASPTGERLRGRKEGTGARQTPGGVRGAGFHFGFGWRAERWGPPSPAVPAAWHGRQRRLPAPPSTGCDRAFAKPRPHAGGPPAGRSRAAAKPRRECLAGPGASAVLRAGREEPAPRGTAALRRLRGKQDPAAVRCTGACSWQPPDCRCLQGRGYKLNIVCAAGTKYPGLTGVGEGGRDCVRPPMMNNPGRPPGCGGQIALGSAKRSAATSARASGGVGLSPAGSGSAYITAERTALPPQGPPARGWPQLGISPGRRMRTGV
ncbi:collagen alpha-1(III) chain-like [Prinia subflava]|uniref:collagen alpha-1(III) chain-like n=1 Tax=Prinia subflava TaxID=208062 RepID=UPI002FDF74F3